MELLTASPSSEGFGQPRKRHITGRLNVFAYLCNTIRNDMEIKLKKWFENPDGKTRYKVVVPAENFVECPTKEVHFTAGIQVVKDDTIENPAKYNLTLFGEQRVQWLKDLGILTTGLSWQRETLNIANGITQATTIYMKKKDIVAVLEKVMPLEIADMGNNPMTKPEFCNLKLK